MKKILAILLIAVMLLSLAACSEPEYEPVPSTEEEAEVVMTLELDGKSYDVKYELYRAFFLTYKDEVTGGNDTLLSGDGSALYIAEINELVLDRIAAIYSVFAVCERIGYDLYSKSVDKLIDKHIRESIEGGSGAVGYGSYEKYLEALTAMNLNYSVQTLLYRYAIGLDAIDNHYIGTFSADDIGDTIVIGELTYTREDVLDYYFSDACLRMLRAHIQHDAYYDPMEYAATVKERMEEAALIGESSVASVIINTGLTAPTEVQRGYVIGRYSLDPLYYEELTDAAFELDVGEVSDPIIIHNGNDKIIFIVYNAQKSNEHFDECYSEIAYVYLTDSVGKIMDEVKNSLEDSVSYTDAYRAIDHASIRMN